MSHISLFLRIRSNWSHVTTSLGFADVIGRRFFARDIYANAKKRKNLRLEVLFTGNRGPAASFYFAVPKFFAALRFLLFFLIVYNFLLFSFYLFLFYFYIRFFNILFYLFISIYYTVFHYFCLHCVFLFWLFLFCDMWYASEMRRRRHGDAENRSGLVVCCWIRSAGAKVALLAGVNPFKNASDAGDSSLFLSPKDSSLAYSSSSTSQHSESNGESF